MDQEEEKPLNFSTGCRKTSIGSANGMGEVAVLVEGEETADQENGALESRPESAMPLDTAYNASSLFLSAAPFLNHPYMQSLAAMTASAMMSAAYTTPALKQARLHHPFSFEHSLSTLQTSTQPDGSSSSGSSSAAAVLAVNSLLQACGAAEGGSSPCPSPAHSPIQTHSATSSSSSLFCVVCSDVSSGKHYGILACNGCSGFFKRSVRRRLIYRCQAGTGTCVVDKAHRNQCQACRLKKCLSKGMNKDAVQNERQPRNTATIHNSSPHPDFYNHSSLFPDNSLASTLHLIHHQHQDSLLPPAVSLSSALEQFANHSSTTPDNQLFNSSLILGSDSSFSDDLLGRLLYMAVKWAKTMPSFSSLSMADQLSLLEAAWPDLFLLSTFQWTIGAGADKCALMDKAVEDVYDQFRHHSLDQGEVACLKAICLFRPEVTGLQNGGYVEGLQDQAQVMLQQHSARRYATLTRFGRLLLLLPQLRAIGSSKVLEKKFLKAVFADKSVNKVIVDIYKS